MHSHDIGYAATQVTLHFAFSHLSSHHFVMQSLPAESQLSLHLLEDSEDLDHHIHTSPSTESQASPDLLEPLQLTDVAGSPVPQLPELPGLPLLLHVSDSPEASRDVACTQITEADGPSQHLLEENGPNTCRPRSRINFMNRCVRTTKSFAHPLYYYLHSKYGLDQKRGDKRTMILINNNVIIV